MAKRTNNDLQSLHIKLRSSSTNPTKNRSECRCSGRVSSYCSASGTRHVNLATNPVISHEWGKDQEVFTTKSKIYVVICDTDIP
jgi:hypothetical protein